MHISLLICDTALAVMVRHYIVKGRVQGVGFRWFVQREAYEIGLRGWVRNTADGDVEVLAAGSEEQIRKLHGALARGSRGSRVDAIEERHRPEAEAESLQAFEIEGAW
ncbi:MAG TPA: acylphosphatase [Acidobacteriaceae bacterium]|nr:acylphosphatase [Acidobacteriaceae bacterium]